MDLSHLLGWDMGSEGKHIIVCTSGQKIGRGVHTQLRWYPPLRPLFENDRTLRASIHNLVRIFLPEDPIRRFTIAENRQINEI